MTTRRTTPRSGASAPRRPAGALGAMTLALAVGAVLAATGCSDDGGTTVAPGGDDADARFTIEQTLSDEAQRNTIAFDGLAFLTGNLGSQSFLPPGKVADYSGFQYLRDNDPTNLGHNTSFVTIVAFNVLHILDADQVARLVAGAREQVTRVNEFAYQRYPLLDGFRRELDGELPAGCAGLDSSAVVAYAADLYRLDGEISYRRAKLMGGVLRSLSTAQHAQLEALKALGGVGNWDATLTDPLRDQRLEPDVSVAVMTFASEMYAWFAGSVTADVYFCPERQGTYFGSFYLKDWPAMGNPDYTINEQLTASAGRDFLAALTAEQAALVTGLVDLQREALQEIVDRREDISVLLRAFLRGTDVDSSAVIEESARYGELDGAIGYLYATRFTQVARDLDDAGRARLDALASDLGYLDPTGGFLYSAPIDLPSFGDTDFLFGADAATGFVLTSAAVGADGALPAAYTCDGAGGSPPLAWTGAPAATQEYAVVVHHVDPEGVIKWYWVLYGLPAATTSLPAGVSGLGTCGNNSVDGSTAYAPPCSQGPGPKTYVCTVYALSAPPALTVEPAQVSRAVLLAAIADRTLASASLNVTYTR